MIWPNIQSKRKGLSMRLVMSKGYRSHKINQWGSSIRLSNTACLAHLLLPLGPYYKINYSFFTQISSDNSEVCQCINQLWKDSISLFVFAAFWALNCVWTVNKFQKSLHQKRYCEFGAYKSYLLYVWTIYKFQSHCTRNDASCKFGA